MAKRASVTSSQLAEMIDLCNDISKRLSAGLVLMSRKKIQFVESVGVLNAKQSLARLDAMTNLICLNIEKLANE